MSGRHLDRTPRPPLRARLHARAARLRWLGWVAATGLYGWLALEVAQLGLPEMVAVLIVAGGGCAFAAGHVRGTRETD